MSRFGTWAPLANNWASQPKMPTVDILSIHTMVGGLAGTDAYFRRNTFAGTFSHFGVGGDGECTQWQDTAYRAAANYNGNWHIISVECADIGPQFPTWNTNDGSAVPAFTSAQCETLAQLIATMCKAHNIPCELIPDAKVGRRGVGYHRMGVPGYMVPGAEQWSTATGKVCPGNRRIAQIPSIIARANAILGGAPVPPEDDMPTVDEILDAPVQRQGVDPSKFASQTTSLRAVVANLDALFGALRGAVDAVPDSVLNKTVTRAGGRTGTTNLGQTIAWLDSNLGELGGKVTSAVAAQDPEALANALKDALGDQLAADVAARLRVTAG